MMKRNAYYPILFVLFLLSGFCGLLYQIIWLRLAFAAFGVITPVLSVVVSIFMLGLAIGSWIGGRYIGSITGRIGWSAIVFYGAIELMVGIGALLVPKLFAAGEALLLSAGSFDSLNYLVLSGVILGFSILPPCICMGATVPFMMSFIREFNKTTKISFSYLYLANVIGALVGTALTAGFLIELLGLHKTLLLAVCLNIGIAITSFVLNFRYPYRKFAETADRDSAAKTLEGTVSRHKFIIAVLFVTGFTSMAMEVVWTRAFTPVLKTTIYSFAAILSVYLLATSIGSSIYRVHAGRRQKIGTPVLIAYLSCFAFLPVVLGDPRIPLGQVLKVAAVLFSIFPFCALLGYMTPKLVDMLSEGNPKSAGWAYAVNIMGCIVGPLSAGYLLLPRFGVRFSLILLAIPFLLFLAYRFRDIWFEKAASAVTLSFFSLVFLAGSMGFFLSYEDSVFYRKGVVRRDHVATVISCGDGMQKRLLVNGIGMTQFAPFIKQMAHFPLAVQAKKPESILIICFGMGTTFRSAASWDINTTAVELVPSVRDAFGYYFSDADEVLAKTNTRVIIDDGRRFLRRTREKFDVITIDPPPPPESSCSGLLYSEEFYNLLKARLRENGILAQWIPGAEKTTVLAAAKSIHAVFPYMRVFRPTSGYGFHFFASMQPFDMPSVVEFRRRLPAKAVTDFLEWTDSRDPGDDYSYFLLKEIPDEEILPPGYKFSITDDRPFNEYFLVRRALRRLSVLTGGMLKEDASQSEF